MKITRGSIIITLLLSLFLFQLRTYGQSHGPHFQDETIGANNELSIHPVNFVTSVPTNGPEQFFIDFVGTGNLQANIAQANEDVQGSAGLGVVFERYLHYTQEKYLSFNEMRFFKSFDMEAYINVASSVDSLVSEYNDDVGLSNQRLFGGYIQNPISSKQSIFINSNVYFNPTVGWDSWARYIPRIISGANFRINASNILWNFNDDNTDFSKYAGAINIRFGIFHEFLPDDKIRDDENRRKFSVILGLNYGFREIVGDISSNTNNELRNRFLGTTDTSFSGLEPSFGFRLNNIIAEFTMPMVRGSSERDVEGLTDTQFLFSIRFIGGFSLKVGEDEVKENENESDDDNDGESD